MYGVPFSLRYHLKFLMACRTESRELYHRQKVGVVMGSEAMYVYNAQWPVMPISQYDMIFAVRCVFVWLCDTSNTLQYATC